MTKPDAAPSAPLFNQDMADAYDRRNSALAPITESLHFLMRLVLSDLPEAARVLCVGVGTGGEILSLAQANPGWRFVGVDPSAQMLAVARRRLDEAGVLARCELVHGYAEDAPHDGYDAAVSLLVAHFIPPQDRPAYYTAIHQRLRPAGRFVSAEISADLDAPVFPQMLEDWKRIQSLMGATPESLATLGALLREGLAVVAPDATETLWRTAGFASPVPFFQAFMIRGWHAEKA